MAKLVADVCSLFLTAVSSLPRNYVIVHKSTGRLEVGNESLIDKAKSVKSVLAQLFEPVGNTSLAGADTINACYGGTRALLDAVWEGSRSWDGRNASFVASDIARYKEASSRPTGGAGRVAMLIGVFDWLFPGTYYLGSIMVATTERMLLGNRRA